MSDGEIFDAPNQQVVRPDGSGPGDEGSGGSTRAESKDEATEREERLEAEGREEPAEPERRGPGRPKGSKNRPKENDNDDEDAA